MWTDKYIGLMYEEERFDCMDLALKVARKELGITPKKPSYEPNPWSQRDSVNKNIASVCKPVTLAQDKQPVLFIGRKRFYHIGIYAEGGYVLHNDQKAGAVILTKLREMKNLGYEFEGYYKWII